jgi:hypothetical protein
MKAVILVCVPGVPCRGCFIILQIWQDLNEIEGTILRKSMHITVALFAASIGVTGSTRLLIKLW